MLNIRQVIAVSITSLIVGSFSLAPALSVLPEVVEEPAIKQTVSYEYATMHIASAVMIEEEEEKVTVKLKRNTITTSRSEARKALESQYSEYFDVETLAFLIVYVEGWEIDEWKCLSKLWHKESGFNPNAQNKKSTAYGVAQFLDSTWENYGFEKTSSPEGQITAGISYIEQRYGSACNAWEFWSSKRWY